MQMINIEYYDEVRRLLQDAKQRENIIDQIEAMLDTLVRSHDAPVFNIQLQYINNQFTLHREIQDRSGFLAEAVLYKDADVPELYDFMKDYLLQDAADQLNLKGAT